MTAAIAVSASEQTPRAEGLLRMLMGFEASQVLMVAHELGIFSTLAAEPASAENVCQRLGLPCTSGERLIHTCVALGLLESKNNKVANSALAEMYLVPGKTSYLGGLVDYYQGEFYTVYGRLRRAVEENRPQLGDEPETPIDLFSATENQPLLQQRFLEAMHRLGLWEGERLATMFPFDRIKTLLDVGGGSGALAIMLAKHYPHLKIQIFDRPSVCPLAKEFISQEQMQDHIALVPGDFWQDALPRNSGAILLSMVLHDWSPVKSLHLLKRCFNALPPGGHMLIFEQVLNEDRCGPLVTCLTNLTMLLRTESGTEYTESDFRHLLQEAGYHSIEVIRTPGLRQLIHAIKP